MLNFGLMKSWQNWLIILLMVWIGIYATHIIGNYFKEKVSAAAS